MCSPQTFWGEYEIRPDVKNICWPNLLFCQVTPEEGLELGEMLFAIFWGNFLLPGQNASASRDTPAQTWKSGIISIKSNPLTPGLNGQSRKPGIGRQVPPGISHKAQSFKDFPMLGMGVNNYRMGLIKQNRAEVEHFLQIAGLPEYSRMSGNPNHTAQYLGRHPESGLAINHTF